MAKTKAQPLGIKILLDIPETSAGSIMIQQGAQIQEQAKILDMGPDVYQVRPELKVGDTIHYKAWAVDIITVDKEKFYYISADSDAICAIVN